MKKLPPSRRIEDYPHYYFKISEEFKTPSIPWAQPFAGRKPRVLYLVPFGTTREIVEIAQRADFPYSHVPLYVGTRSFADGSHAAWNPRAAAIAAARAGRFDVAAVGSFDPAVLPEEAWKALISKVAAGKGLVVVRTGNLADPMRRAIDKAERIPPPPFLRTGIPWERARGLHEKSASLFSLGKGRIVLLDYIEDASVQERKGTPWIASLLPFESNRDQRQDSGRTFEHAYDLLIRCLLWAGDSEPRVELLQFRPRGFLREDALPRFAVRREDLPQVRWAAEFGFRPGAPRRLRVETVLLNGWSEEVHRGEAAVSFDRPPDPRAAAAWRGEGPGFREQHALDPRRFIRGLEGGNRNEILLPLPDLRPGPHLLVLRGLDEKGRVACWGSGAFEVEDRVTIREVGFERGAAWPGEKLDGWVAIENHGGPAAPLLRVEARDGFGRLVHVEERAVEIPPGGRVVPISLRIDRPLSTWRGVRAVLSRGERVLAEGRGEFVVGRPAPAGDWFVSIWTSRNETDHHFGAARIERFRELGADQGMANPYQVRTPNAAAMHARANLTLALTELIPGQYLRVEKRDLKAPRDLLVRRPCLTDPEFVAMVLAHARRWAREYGERFAAADFLIGDEINYGIKPPQPHDFCHSATCLAGFRAWLKERYGEIGRLNEAWGARLRGFDAARPRRYAQALRRTSRLGPWLDHRLYQTRVFVDFMEKVAREVRRENPRARFGVSGTQEPTIFNGYDWAAMMSLFDNVQAYSGIQDELIRSFARPGALLTRWDGYDPFDENERRARLQPWYRLLHGFTGVSYYLGWSPGGGAPWQGLILPDLSLRNAARWMKEETTELKSGIARLLLGARPEKSGIGILFSYPSLGAATALQGGEGYAVHYQGLYAWKELLEDAGFQYDFVSYLDLREGKAALERFKVLILPFAALLSDDEVAAIRRFAEDGGVVVADQAPGIYDDFGVLRPGRLALDEFFGIRRRKFAPLWEPRELRLAEAAGDLGAGLEGSPVSVYAGEAAITPHGALPLGLLASASPNPKSKIENRKSKIARPPALLFRRHGKGAAWLLNFSFRGYAEHESHAGAEDASEKLDASAAAQGQREIVRALLGRAGVRPLFELRNGEGREPTRTEKFLFQDGSLRYAAFLKKHFFRNWWTREGPIQWELEEKATLLLDRPGHVYDARRGTYVGYTEALEASAVPAITRVFSILPYRVVGLSALEAGPFAAGSKAAVPAELVIEGAEKPGRHVFHVEVTDARGRERPEYAQNVEAPEGRAEIGFDLALDDPAGTWRVVLRDAATGVRKECRFGVTGGDRGGENGQRGSASNRQERREPD